MNHRLIGLIILMMACLGCREAPPPPTASASAASLKALIDSVMPRLQVLAGLPLERPVQMEQQNRDTLRKYIESRMGEEMPDQELAGIRALYITLGLMPADLDLKALLLDLYTEQVVGYYDPRTKKLFVVTGSTAEQVRPVLVHELVHALQDQHTNLDSLIAPERGNDVQTAAQAAIEGHATMVMVAFMAEQQSHAQVDLRTLPDIGAQIRPSLEAQNAQFPVFKKAPRILRETLIFPYVEGSAFVQKLWLRPLQTGFGEPFPAPLGTRLPSSTEQVMQPESRFLVNRDEPTEISLSAANGPVIRENTLGEFELSVFLSEHVGTTGPAAAEGWDGDRYRLISTPAGTVILWLFVWDDVAGADRFAAAYRSSAAKRGRTVRVERIELSGRPAVRVINGPTPASIAGLTINGALK